VLGAGGGGDAGAGAGGVGGGAGAYLYCAQFCSGIVVVAGGTGTNSTQAVSIDNNEVYQSVIDQFIKQQRTKGDLQVASIYSSYSAQRTDNVYTQTHPLNGPSSRTTRISRYQKGKTNLDFTEARQ